MLGDGPHGDDSQEFPDAITILAAGVSVILGLALGSSGPLIAVSIGAGIVAGPTWGGIVLLLAIGIAALSGVAGFAASMIGRGSHAFGALLLVSVALAIGIIGGAALGNEWQPGG
jgi:hypothetical protein